jgi:hypothetical protein
MTNEDRKQGWQARAAAVRRAEERKAALLEERGWVCIPPEKAIGAPVNHENPGHAATRPSH